MKYLILLISLCLFSSASLSACIQGNCVNGYGTYTWPDGRKYVGQYKDGKRHGQGTQTRPDGRIYVGQWKDHNRHGQGTQTRPGGEKYVGQYKDDEQHGQGTYTWPDGRIYVGQFRYGKRHDQGTETWPDGRTYVGQWENNKRHGQGSFTLPDGEKYVGQYKDDEQHGQGTYYLVDGRQLIFKRTYIELHGANGQLLRASVNRSELSAIRGESAERKRLADEQSLEQGRREKTQIAGIQEQLIGHKYLIGIADGIASNKTTNAVKAFYRDAGISRPALDDYMTIAEDLYQKLLTPVGNCPYDSTSASGFSVCFTVE